jgi:hypothetical protein
MFSAAFTVFVQIAVEAILFNDMLQLPVLTIPFVASTWLIMLSRSAWLEPIAKDGEDFDDVRHQNHSENTVISEKSLSVTANIEVVKKKVMARQESWRSRDSDQRGRRRSLVSTIQRVPSITLPKISSFRGSPTKLETQNENHASPA